MSLPAFGCVAPRGSRSHADGDAQLASGRFDDAEGSYWKASALATTAQAKVRAQIGASRARRMLGQPQEALRILYEARKLEAEGEAAIELNLALGETYYALGEYGLARRYLLKGLPARGGPNLDRALAKLVLCCRALEDLEGAARYRGKISLPHSPEVVEILSGEAAPRAGRARSEALAGDDEPGAEPREERRPRPTRPEAEEPEPAGSHGDRLVVLSRSRWNARATRANVEAMGPVSKITIHHSAGSAFTGRSQADVADELLRIQRYHQSERGWADIGYHYAVDRTGMVWQGRSLKYQGAHARGAANHGNIGIVLLGNYMTQTVTTAQRRSLEALVEKLCDHFAIPPQRVYTHSEILGGRTDCPGPAIARCVREIRSSLQRKLVAFRKE